MHIKHIEINSTRFPVQDEYPFCLELMQKTHGLDFRSPVVFFAGENGSGKSTLLEAIARACGVYIWQGDTRTRARYNPYEASLYQFVSVTWALGHVPGSFFAADIFKNFSRIVDEWASTDPGVLEYFGGKSLMTQSHGQSLMSFFRSRFAVPGIYFLDEPEAALSPKTQLALLDVLGEAVAGGQAQFIIASHSPILMSCSGAEIISFDTVPVSRVKYRDTEHFKVYRDFLNNAAGAGGEEHVEIDQG